MRGLCCGLIVGFVTIGGLVGQNVVVQGTAKALPSPVHEANFDTERSRANELFLAGKTLEASPLYEDLCRQDQTIAVFAERRALGLLFREATVPVSERAKIHDQAMAELRRAKALGDDSPLVQSMASMEGKTPLGALLSGVPMTVGYSYHGNAAAQEPMRAAEAAFSRGEYATAIPLYERAVAADPAWYVPPLTLGDTYFRQSNWVKAGEWFQRAIAIDPYRDTAYRYWGDALFKSGDRAGAKRRYEDAIIAEPYARTGWNALSQWLQVTHSTMRPWPEIVRPEWTTGADGALQIDPAAQAETGDGHASWLIYEQHRVARGARGPVQAIFGGSVDIKGQLKPVGYRHSLVEETDALEAMLADVQAKLASGAVTAERLEPSLRALLQLKKEGWLECWILLRGADAGLRSDYPAFRAAHREKLVDYVDSMVKTGGG